MYAILQYCQHLNYFVDYKLNVTSSEGSTSAYREYFLSYVGVASKLPNVMFQAFNLATQNSYCSLTFRIFACIVLEVVIFAGTIALAVINTDSWVEIFFIITMISIVLINMANGVFQSCLYAVAAKLPMKYTNAVTTGLNISGIFTAIAMIIAIAASSTMVMEAVYYFSASILYLIISFVTYIFVPNNAFFKHYQSLKSKELETESPAEINENENAIMQGNDDESDNSKIRTWIKNTRGCWMQCANVFVIYFVSLSIFPAIQANIAPVSDIINAEYFSPVFCFLSFNLFSMVGNLIAGRYKLFSKKTLWIPSVIRLLFIPIFLFCNYYPKQRKLPVLFDDDYSYICIG
ncbi:equilibrative nucleoside transporter 1-like isoform X2, partial [Leptotrombidium deliense]